MPVTDAETTSLLLHDATVLTTLRIQEAGQRIGEAADLVVAFLAAGHGRVVDTALSSDEIREVVVVGHIAGGASPDGPEAEA